MYFTAVFELGDGVKDVRNIAVYRSSVYNTIQNLFTIVKGGIQLSSSKSLQISLEDVKRGRAGLNKHRQSLLERVPKTGDWAKFAADSISMKDIAFLTAKTGDEFAILKGKKADILFHGSKNSCLFDGVLCDMLVGGQVRLYGHSHPAERVPAASSADRNTLSLIGQKKSRIISAITGREIEFTDWEFDDGIISGRSGDDVDIRRGEENR